MARPGLSTAVVVLAWVLETVGSVINVLCKVIQVSCNVLGGALQRVGRFLSRALDIRVRSAAIPAYSGLNTRPLSSTNDTSSMVAGARDLDDNKPRPRLTPSTNFEDVSWQAI